MMIKKHLEEFLGSDEVCVKIETEYGTYSLAFIEFEDEEWIGINNTSSDGRERYSLIPKSIITNVGIVYEQDINILDGDTSEDGIMFV